MADIICGLLYNIKTALMHYPLGSFEPVKTDNLKHGVMTKTSGKEHLLMII